MKNLYLDARTTADIDDRIDRIHRDLDYKGGKIDLLAVRELLRLDLHYYQADDPDLVDQVVHKLKVAGKQVLKRPGLLMEAVRKFDLSALFIPDAKRILIDATVPELKRRWYESHEVAHSLIPWHADYMLGDDKSTLSQGCHEIIEAEANYGGGRLLFPRKLFEEAHNSAELTLAHVRKLATEFGNTITSTLWRCVEQSGKSAFAVIGEHPRRPREGKQRIEYFVGSRPFEKQFSNITEGDVWAWLQSYSGYKPTGPLGTADILVADLNGEMHEFNCETFSNGHNALTLGRYRRPIVARLTAFAISD